MESYLEFIKSADISKGDTVYLVSDITKLGLEAYKKGERLDMNKIIDELMDMVGEEGNLLFPVFSWDFCRGKGFDIRNTKSTCGSLTEVARKRPEFKRTKHPMYSFMVWGKDQDYLCSLENVDSWGEDTIFEWLDTVDAKCLSLGVHTLYGFTGSHHMEQKVGVTYRYNKYFTGEYTDEKGETSTRTYSMYVRDLEINALEIDEKPLGKIMEKDGTSQVTYYGKVPMCVFRVRDAYAMYERDICKNGSRLMYTFPNIDGDD